MKRKTLPIRYGCSQRRTPGAGAPEYSIVAHVHWSWSSTMVCGFRAFADHPADQNNGTPLSEKAMTPPDSGVMNEYSGLVRLDSRFKD